MSEIINYGLDEQLEIFVQKGFIEKNGESVVYTAPEEFDMGDFCKAHDNFNGVMLDVSDWTYSAGLMQVERHGELRGLVETIRRLHGLLVDESNQIQIYQSARIVRSA